MLLIDVLSEEGWTWADGLWHRGAETMTAADAERYVYRGRERDGEKGERKAVQDE